MDFQQSAVPFPLATVGLASPREEAEGASDAFQLPAITRPRPHLQHKPSQPARNSSFTQLHAAAPLSRRPSVVNNQSFFEGVEFATRVCTSRRPESRTASRQNSQTGQLRSPLTPLRRTLADEEEGFLSDGEDDMPLWSDDYDHFQQESNFSFEEDADGSPRIFEEGDRVGVGMHHHGSLAKDCFAHPVDKSARRLEIIRKLGSGSYAVVYLARAVLWDPDVDGIDSEDGEAGLEFGQEVVYGQEFALKCLCKQNLSDELLEVQRFEATLHQKVPSHPNIVEMHGAFETDGWLFLVLEYCPGQDLFYWLEQAKDHEEVDDEMHPAAAFMAARAQQERLSAASGPESHSATPPSPSLLSETTMSALLSRRRLRLIGRMFQQMCDAVQASHNVGISHRDIKPENFLCCEDTGDSMERRVTVKIMDWGLGTTDEECGDFDCGSKPYMAYECRNNLAPTYLPKSADVWSLGIVLLNLLFHRCPWGDPSDDDIDFYAYRINPVAFLLDRFVGIGREVATYLAENVLNCQGPRVSAGQLGQWAQNLVRMMSDPAPTKPRTAKVSDAAKPLTATHPDATFRRMSYVASPDASQRARPRGSLLSQVLSDNPSPAQSPQAFEMKDLPVVMENQLQMNDWQRSDKTLSPTSPLGASRLETVPGSPPEADTLSQVIAAADATSESDAQALANKAKRRKRGARRGRSAARAEASEAREADSRSRPTKDENSTASHFSQQRPGPTQNSSPRSTLAPSKPNASRFAGLKGAFKNGNQDLEMFAQRAREREALMNKATASAPAKMQAAGGGSYSFGTSSAQSNKSTWSTDDDMRSHWNSTAARRERLGRRAGQKKPFSDTSSATSPSSTTFSRTSGMSSEPTSGSETSATSPHRSSPRAIEPEATVKQTPMISLSRIDEQLQPRRERPEPPTQVPAPQKPKAKGGFFKGLFR